MKVLKCSGGGDRAGSGVYEGGNDAFSLIRSSENEPCLVCLVSGRVTTVMIQLQYLVKLCSVCVTRLVTFGMSRKCSKL